MKRFVLFPALAIYAVIVVAASFQAQHLPLASVVPTVDAKVLPGNPVPAGFTCHYEYTEYLWRYCESGDVWLAVKEGIISRTDLFTYYAGLRAGDLVSEWGIPRGADYYRSGAVELYWLDRYAYIYGPNISPLSRVGFIAYGKQPVSIGKWQGFRSGQR